ALSAAQGVVLDGKVTQLEAKVDDISTGKYYGYYATSADLPDSDSVPGFAYVGTGPTYTIYNFNGTAWASTGVTVSQSPIGNDDDIDKLSEILSAQYSYGDIDTRPLITIVILNSITDANQKESLRREMSDDLKKAWTAAEKYRGKKVKPAKQKKPSFMQKMMAESIENQKAYDSYRR
ncbi:MAG: hypothetical protein IIZ18_00310, partial [Ruminococcus sp.]|nr:hypothetical protein [Ruminococcus sp.]